MMRSAVSEQVPGLGKAAAKDSGRFLCCLSNLLKAKAKLLSADRYSLQKVIETTGCMSENSKQRGNGLGKGQKSKILTN